MADKLPPYLKAQPRVDRLWTVGPGVIRGIVHGALPNKSNSKKLVPIRGRMRIIQGDDVREYTARFEDACWRSCKAVEPLPEGAKLYLKAVVWQQNLQRDLDCELLPDLLQRFNLITNDRAFWKKDYLRRLDRENPRTEFELGIWSDPEEKTLFG
jgi:hypothetical protein